MIKDEQNIIITWTILASRYDCDISLGWLLRTIQLTRIIKESLSISQPEDAQKLETDI
jgi:hypothetical protein